jgi:hypothetical protein
MPIHEVMKTMKYCENDLGLGSNIEHQKYRISKDSYKLLYKSN